MTNSGRYFLFLLALVSCVYIAACTQERQPCLTPTIAGLNMKTLQFKSGTILPVDTALPSAVFGALTANGVKGFVFPRQSAFSIPLSPVIDSSTWVIKTDSASTNTVYDTLVLYYKRQQQFISNACGYAYFFNLDSISTTHNFIDSILIINASVTNNVNANNLQVYIHPGS